MIRERKQQSEGFLGDILMVVLLLCLIASLYMSYSLKRRYTIPRKAGYIEVFKVDTHTLHRVTVEEIKLVEVE